MAAKRVIELPHIGIRAGYELSNGSYDSSKPTCVLINSMCTTVSLYRDQLSNDKRLTGAVNLLAIEPLGHGKTECVAEQFTYWDTAIMALQVLDALGIEKCFALGTSQGGWVVARMALLEPGRIQGILILGSSMDAETAQTREEGCWDPAPFVRPFIEERWAAGAAGTPDPGLRRRRRAATPENTAFWTEALREVYRGDAGRRKLRMATIALVERDGLLFRLPYIQCPVHWLHGTDDPVYSPEIPKKQIKLFTGSKEAKLDLLEGGAHFLNATHPKEMVDAILQMAAKYGQ
ncbi:Alpha/Beta hydrolase protein [Apiospora sp. TS-2023a]